MSIYDQVLAFIASPGQASFERLALEVFCHQFETVPAYRRYCLEIGVSARDVDSIAGIPVVSTLAFKHARLCGAGDHPRMKIFQTSGTTLGVADRGRHYVPKPEVYRASASRHLAQMLFPDRRKMSMLALHPTAEVMPESSLSQMLTWCIEDFCAGRALCAANRQTVDCELAEAFLREAERAREPVCIVGTTAAFAALFEHLATRDGIRLAAGSRMMDTGGAKGQRIPLTAIQVADLANRWLSIPQPMVVNEYGMTEMCSQLYDATGLNSASDLPPGERRKIAPAWVRATAIDPVSMRPLEAGQIGLLSFFDLANVGSVSAILTEDLGIVDGEGVRILGRSAASEPRGCALGIEEFASSETA